MTYTLRPYQRRAADAALQYIRTSVEPCLIEAATGAGKSLVIAEIAAQVHRMSKGKRVLCLAPSAELVEQNRAKYLATGEPASMFSASAGSKSLRHPVVFGTPGTVVRSISRFTDKFAAVVIDEAHGITPTIKRIVETMREGNPNLRVIGLSATPYRLGEGYIYRIDTDGRPTPEHATRDPWFHQLVDCITAHELIDQGYLTPPLIGAPLADEYDTSALTLNSRGQFDSTDVDAAFVGHGRKTAAIVADVVAQSRDRMGVMFFAATVQHAEEIMASLPQSISAIVTSKTPKAERRSILARFKARQIKYLVNVSVLTTGFDAEHVDVIALLRRTESVGLMQQIIGRGLRLHDDKTNCLVLDYAGNIDNHCPDGDIFAPDIKAHREKTGGGVVSSKCPACATVNEFSARQNPDEFELDDEGYFLDLAGNRIEVEGVGAMPGHYGRRCLGGTVVAGRFQQCSHRWSHKQCPACDAENDIAARYCHDCKAELVNPNEKLRIEFRQLKRSPRNRQTDEVLKCDVRESVSQAGNETIRLDITTPYRSFSFWMMKEPRNSRALADLDRWKALDGATPETVTYQKGDDGFYRIFAWNQPKDEEPTAP